MARPYARWVAIGCNVLVVAVAVAFVWLQLEPHLVLSKTTPAGGDMGAHVWGPDYLRHHLFHRFRLTGWTPDWYAGFPALTFYFPAPTVVIALLSFVIPYGVAFKLVTVSGLLALPLCAALFAKWCGMRRPAPAIVGLATVFFLFDRGWTIYGGNVASTLAGEFSFEISLALAFLFLGVLARSLDTGRHRGWAAVLLAATILCHILPALFAVVVAIWMWSQRPGLRRLWTALSVGVTGLLIGGFWLLPFAWRQPYTNDMGWEKLGAGTTKRYAYYLFGSGRHADLVKDNLAHLHTLFLLGLLGAVVTVALRRRVGTVLTLVAATYALLFRFMPQGKLWNARALPFWYLCLYLLAACLVVEGAHLVEWGLQELQPRTRRSNLARADELATQSRMLSHLAHALRLPGAPGLSGVADWFEQQAVDARRSAESIAAWPQAAVAFLTLVATMLAVGVPLNAFRGVGYVTTESNFVKSWATWNFTGYEGAGDGPSHAGAKSRKNEYFAIVQMMDKLGRSNGCGRALWEYEPEEDQMGTPDALMLLPTWTHGCIGSEEGLYYESSPTVPYHFLLNGVASLHPSDPQRDLPYGSLDLQTAIPMMQELGVRYYMALTPETQTQADADPRLHELVSSGPWTVTYDAGAKERTWKVYQVADSDLVVPLEHLPVVVRGLPKTMFGAAVASWQSMGIGWFAQSQPGRYDIPLAAEGPSNWPRVSMPPAPAAPTGQAAPKQVYPGAYSKREILQLERARQLGATVDLPDVAVTPTTVTNIKSGDDSIGFDVDQIGQPVLVKVSYFPNWRASGAKKVYRVSPNFMVVVPTAHHVTLRYGVTPVDWAGDVMTLLGLVLAFVLARRVRDPNAPLRRRARRDGGGGGGGGGGWPGEGDPDGPRPLGVAADPDSHPWWSGEPDVAAPDPDERKVLVGVGGRGDDGSEDRSRQRLPT